MANTGQFKKGESGNRKGRPKKNTITYGFNKVAIPTEGNSGGSILGGQEDWIPFGDDNMFPHAVAELGRKSVNHRSILTYKNIYVSGQGFTSEDNRTLEFIERVNSKNETLKQVTDKLFRDYNEGGNAYMEIVKVQGAVMLFHKDWTKARLKSNGKAVLFHPNWSRAKQEPEKMIDIPLYPEFGMVEGKEGERSIVHFKSYEPEFNFYGLPNWVAGMTAAAIAYKTNKWNVSRLNNSFASSGVLVVEGDMSAEDAAKLKADVTNEFTGEGKQGKILTIIKALGGAGTTYTPISTSAEGDWIQLKNQSTDDLVMAHNWFRSLSGIADNTGFDTQRIRNEYAIAHSSIIPRVRSEIMPDIRKILMEQLNIGEDLRVKDVSGISILDKLDANSYIFKWEAREMAGLDSDPDDPQQQEYVKIAGNGSTNNSTGSN